MRFKQMAIVVLVVVCLSGCTAKSSAEENVQLDEMLQKYSSEYVAAQENDEGGYEVTVVAPDFTVIAKTVIEDGAPEITVELLEEVIQNADVENKIYHFTVDELTDDSVRSAFNNQVAYDLLIAAIESVDYKEGDGLP